ncbi:MAG: hypothetical protein WCM76_05825 [Bacteroidota bacterium]
MNHASGKRNLLLIMSALMLAIVFIVSSCRTHRQAAKYGAPPTNFEEKK